MTLDTEIRFKTIKEIGFRNYSHLYNILNDLENEKKNQPFNHAIVNIIRLF